MKPPRTCQALGLCQSRKPPCAQCQCAAHRFPYAPGTIDMQPTPARHWVARSVGWALGLGFFTFVTAFAMGYLS